MRLLLAEDERELNQALSTVLRHNNFSVDSAYDGEEALDYIDSNEYDGVILDIMMPKIDGIGVLKTIRSEGNNVPVLFLTAKSEIDDRVEGLDAGADDYLTKPFAMKELLARVRALTRRQGDIADNVLRSGNLTLNKSTFEISVGDSDIRLGNKDFQMMEMLMSNEGVVISAEKFMDKIWGFDSDADISVVWVYISNLRKKLSTLNSDMEIKAIRNQGYVLEKRS
ncbi:MAG: response regulator transcription factor [Lachnospiraceae bacterium]|nr:response regulator transcription factor [Lachnospiraceae bacterium]